MDHYFLLPIFVVGFLLNYLNADPEEIQQSIAATNSTKLINVNSIAVCYLFSKCPWTNFKEFNGSSLEWVKTDLHFVNDVITMNFDIFRNADNDNINLETHEFAISGTQIPDTSPIITVKAILVSGIIPCQVGKAQLTFRYWTSPLVLLKVCTKYYNDSNPSADIEKFDFCNQVNIDQGPGPANILISPANQFPFRIYIISFNFVHSYGGFAIISDLHYIGTVCHNQYFKLTGKTNNEGNAVFNIPFNATFYEKFSKSEIPPFPTIKIKKNQLMPKLANIINFEAHNKSTSPRYLHMKNEDNKKLLNETEESVTVNVEENTGNSREITVLNNVERNNEASVNFPLCITETPIAAKISNTTTKFDHNSVMLKDEFSTRYSVPNKNSNLISSGSMFLSTTIATEQPYNHDQFYITSPKAPITPVLIASSQKYSRNSHNLPEEQNEIASLNFQNGKNSNQIPKLQSINLNFQESTNEPSKVFDNDLVPSMLETTTVAHAKTTTKAIPNNLNQSSNGIIPSIRKNKSTNTEDKNDSETNGNRFSTKILNDTIKVDSSATFPIFPNNKGKTFIEKSRYNLATKEDRNDLVQNERNFEYKWNPNNNNTQRQGQQNTNNLIETIKTTTTTSVKVQLKTTDKTSGNDVQSRNIHTTQQQKQLKIDDKNSLILTNNKEEKSLLMDIVAHSHHDASDRKAIKFDSQMVESIAEKVPTNLSEVEIFSTPLINSTSFLIPDQMKAQLAVINSMYIFADSKEFQKPKGIIGNIKIESNFNESNFSN